MIKPRVLSLLIFSVFSACTVAVSDGSGAGIAVRSNAGAAVGGRGYLAWNDQVVLTDPSVAGQFEVMARSGHAAVDYWCAAGDYVIRGRNMRTVTRIYVVKPQGPSKLRPGARSVTYTVAPTTDVLAAAEALPQSYSMTIRKLGENYIAEHGRTGCRRITPFLLGFGP